MQRIRALIIKEFLQIFRDRTNIGIIFIIPIVQLLILGSALTMDVKNITLGIVDEDNTVITRAVGESFRHTLVFTRVQSFHSVAQAIAAMDRNAVKLIVVLPHDLSREVVLGRQPQVQLILDGVDANSSGIASAYARAILIKHFATKMPPIVRVQTRMFFNPQLDSKTNIVPGILAILLTMVTLFMTAINVVREREIGTLEQLSVTPITKFELIMGKLIPQAVLGVALFTVGVLAGQIIFHLKFVGSYMVLYSFVAIYLFSTLGLGLFLSTLARTQQQAMFFAWFFSVFAIMLSGFFVPLENMPDVVQWLAFLNPARYFMEVVRGVYLKGADFTALWPQAGALFIFGLVVLTLAVARFQKRLT